MRKNAQKREEQCTISSTIRNKDYTILDIIQPVNRSIGNSAEGDHDLKFSLYEATEHHQTKTLFDLPCCVRVRGTVSKGIGV